MWNIFKNKKEFKAGEFELLCKVISLLPQEYKYLKKQCTREFIIGREKADAKFYGKNYYQLLLDSKMYDDFINDDFPLYTDFKGINVEDLKNGKMIKLELCLTQGVFISYKLIGSSHFTNLGEVSLKSLRIEETKTQKPEIIKNLQAKVKTGMLGLKDSFEIEIEEGIFHTVKNLEDGNYLVVNDKGEVFGLWHDPFTVDKIFNTIEDFVNAMESGTFKIDDYITQFYNG